MWVAQIDHIIHIDQIYLHYLPNRRATSAQFTTFHQALI